ncbi:MAG: hypothetical protein AAF721_27205 [Myxococcota bacterium]
MKVGGVLLVLGAMHFTNLYIFARIRRRAQLAYEPPPVQPMAQMNWPVPPAPAPASGA